MSSIKPDRAALVKIALYRALKATSPDAAVDRPDDSAVIDGVFDWARLIDSFMSELQAEGLFVAAANAE